MRVSLIVTVKNEAESLPRLLDSIAAQTRLPDEIVVVDGGSTDGTLSVLGAYAPRLPLRVLSRAGTNISQGRNQAIRAATGDIICSTDSGVWLDPNWAEELLRPFENVRAEDVSRHSVAEAASASVDVVSGFFAPDPHGLFETALAATTLPTLSEIRPAKFLPSSRSVAFRKTAWEKVSGYPEWLDFCEDLVFDFALRDAGCLFVFAPDAVAHFRPRRTLPAFLKQYYQYARGDGKADLWFLRHVIRYTTYFIALPSLIVVTFTAPLLAVCLWILAAVFMFFPSCKRLLPMIRDFSLGDRLRAIAWVPILRVMGDIAKMMGYPVGIVWRVRNRPGTG